jgi:hypothetical protein
MKGQVTVTLWPEDIVNAFTAQEFMKMYGGKLLLSQLFMGEIINNLDIDEVLEFIGEERIREFLNQNVKQEIA